MIEANAGFMRDEQTILVAQALLSKTTIALQPLIIDQNQNGRQVEVQGMIIKKTVLEYKDY